MKLLSNKPFTILIIINIIYLTSLINIQNLVLDTKSNIRVILRNIGIEKYKDKLNLQSDDIVIYFNMKEGIKLSKIIQHKSNYKTFSNETIFHEPAIYEWGGGLYNLKNEGLYYLVNFKKGVSRNVIIYKNNVISLLSSLSWLTVHGNADNGKIFNEKLKKIINQKLSITCGSISTFTSKILNKYHIDNRIVSFLTMDTWNTYDNGHTLIEVKINGKYVLFDLDNNQYFSLNGQYLQAKDFLDNIKFSKLKFIKLSTDQNLDSQGFNNKKNINYTGFADFIYNDLTSWYRRVMQIPIIIKDGKYYVGLNNLQFKDRILKYYPKAILLNKVNFNKKFYGENQ